MVGCDTDIGSLFFEHVVLGCYVALDVASTQEVTHARRSMARRDSLIAAPGERKDCLLKDVQ